MQQRKDPIRSKQTISVLFGRPKVLAATLAKTQSSQLSGASESSSPSSLAHVSRSCCHVASSMVHEWCHGFDAGHKRDQKGLEDVDGCICGCLFCCLLSWKNRKFYFCHSYQTLIYDIYIELMEKNKRKWNFDVKRVWVTLHVGVPDNCSVVWVKTAVKFQHGSLARSILGVWWFKFKWFNFETMVSASKRYTKKHENNFKA